MRDRYFHDLPFPDISKLLPSLTRYARHRAVRPDQVPDLVQEAVRRVLSRLRSGTEIDDIERYLFTALANLCRDQFSRRRTAVREVEFDDETTPDTGTTQLQNFACTEVLEKIGQLSGPHRQILQLVVEGDCSYSEISATLGLPAGTVMSRLARARLALRAAMNMKRREPISSLWQEN